MMSSAVTALQHDKEFIEIPMPAPEIDYPRPPCPPSSEHSSRSVKEGGNDKQSDKLLKKKKKPRLSLLEYIELRNENYKAYLKDLEINPPETQLALLQKKGLGANAGPELEQHRPFPDGVSVSFSDTSRETKCSEPRNKGRARESLKKKCENAVQTQRKQKILLNRELVNGVLSNRVHFQLILEAKWTLIKITRLVQVLEGVKLDCTVNLDWMEFEKDIQKYYGPMDKDSEHFKRLFVAFQMQRWEMIIDMFEEETKMMEKMLEQRKLPSDFPEQLAALRKTRSRLEIKIAATAKFQCDQNPYTNPDNMDFWVMPRPKQTIEVYGIYNEEMKDFLEFHLPAQGDEATEEEAPPEKVFVREGYNLAVFDVGWHYSVEKVYGDVPWKEFFPDEFGDFYRGSLRESEKQWGNHLLSLRGELMTFNPFGVEETYFFRHLKVKFDVKEDEAILGNYKDGVECLSDMAFPQILNTSRDDDDGPKENNILFDSLLEGVIVTPAEMLERMKTRIRFLIDERPNRLLPVSDLQKIYENRFGQKFFPLQWGYKDMEDFLQKEVLNEDLVIVEKDEKEVQEDKSEVSAEIQKEIDAKWASILENDDDDEVEEDYDDEYSDLFEELIHEGPWLSEGEVYRVLD